MFRIYMLWKKSNETTTVQLSELRHGVESLGLLQVEHENFPLLVLCFFHTGSSYGRFNQAVTGIHVPREIGQQAFHDLEIDF